MSRSSPTAIDAAVAQLRSRLGQEVTGPPPYLTEATRYAIRHWAEAIGDDNLLWRDADYGRTTILEIEPPGIGDETRVIPPYRGGESDYFLAINRNKRSLVVDLKQEAGQRVLLDLVPHCDALVENFRPGVLARLGLAPVCPMVPTQHYTHLGDGAQDLYPAATMLFNGH